jgi:hypothetical protein
VGRRLGGGRTRSDVLGPEVVVAPVVLVLVLVAGPVLGVVLAAVLLEVPVEGERVVVEVTGCSLGVSFGWATVGKVMFKWDAAWETKS